MGRRIWLCALLLYAAAGIFDMVHHLGEPVPAGSPTGTVARAAIAFCAGLFWPVDLVARPLLLR
jgi:hypothetical protein